MYTVQEKHKHQGKHLKKTCTTQPATNLGSCIFFSLPKLQHFNDLLEASWSQRFCHQLAIPSILLRALRDAATTPKKTRFLSQELICCVVLRSKQLILVLLTTGLFCADIHKIVTAKNGCAGSGSSVGGVVQCCSAARCTGNSSFMFHTWHLINSPAFGALLVCGE